VAMIRVTLIILRRN